MNSRSKWQNAFAVLTLLATSWVIVATSVLDDKKSNGTFFIQSDCVTPPLSATVTVSSGQISSGGYTYSDFGFPSDTVTGEVVSGVVGSARRVCTLTYGKDDDKEWVYSCFDNEEFVCNIFLE